MFKPKEEDPDPGEVQRDSKATLDSFRHPLSAAEAMGPSAAQRARPAAEESYTVPPKSSLREIAVTISASDLSRQAAALESELLHARLDRLQASLEERPARANLGIAARVELKPSAGTVQVPATGNWSEVTIRRYRDDRERVSVLVGGRTFVLNFTQMGMVDSRTAMPDEQWNLLQVFLKRGGTLGWADSEASPRNQKRKERLAEMLRQVFGIGTDPFELMEDSWNDRPRKAWKTRFVVPPGSV